MKREASPLQWPEGWKRTDPDNRTRSRFAAGQFVHSRDGILKELRLMRAVHPTITSDLPLKSNGMPYATGRVDDPGVAVWWVDAKIGGSSVERVIACDTYKDIADNLHAIQLTLNAMRGIGRWGANQVVERAFAGFAALPPGSGETINAVPVEESIDWREFFEITPLLDGMNKHDLVALIRGRHKRMALAKHPDHGGTREAFDELSKALEAAEAELGTRDE